MCDKRVVLEKIEGETVRRRWRNMKVKGRQDSEES